MLEMELIYFMQINIKVSKNLISTLWTPKFSTRWCYHYRLSILKALKVTSLKIALQYLKKEVNHKAS